MTNQIDAVAASAQSAAIAMEHLGQQLLSLAVPIAGLHSVLSGFSGLLQAGATVVRGITSAFAAGISVFSNVANGIKTFADTLAGVTRPVVGFAQTLGEVALGLGSTIGSVSSILLMGGAALAGALVAVGTVVVKAFVAVVGALVQLFEAAGKVAAGLLELGLAAMPGGLKIFGEVIQYVTSVLGSVFVPVVSVLMAALLAVADMLRGPMSEAVKNVSRWLVESFSTALPVVIKKILDFADTVLSVAMKLAGIVLVVFSALTSAAASLVNFISKITGNGSSSLAGAGQDTAKAMAELGKQAFGVAKDADKRKDDRDKEAGKPGGAFEEGVKDFGEKFKKGMDSVNRAVAQSQSMSANVGFSSIADVDRTVQMQAFQSDIQQRILEQNQKAVEELQELNKNVQNTTPAVGR